MRSPVAPRPGQPDVREMFGRLPPPATRAMMTLPGRLVWLPAPQSEVASVTHLEVGERADEGERVESVGAGHGVHFLSRGPAAGWPRAPWLLVARLAAGRGLTFGLGPVVGLGGVSVASAGQELDLVGGDVDARGVLAGARLELLEAQPALDRDLAAPTGTRRRRGPGSRRSSRRSSRRRRHGR
jgi:hypothetical protein